MKNKERSIAGLVITAVAVAAVLLLCVFLQPQKANAAVASEGKVYLENIDVTGMNQEQIQAVIDAKMAKYSSDIIEIYADDTTAYIPASEFGLYYANEDLAETVASMGMNGNVLARYQMDNYISNNGAVIFSLDLRVDGGLVYNVVADQLCALNRNPVNMKLGRNPDGTFYTIPKVDGFHVLVDETTAALTEYLCNGWHGGVGGFKAVIEVDEAIGSLGGDVNQMTSVIGTGTTNYEYLGENASRASNIANAVSKINGTVVYPGETFSTEALLIPFTEENGYQYAHGFENSDVVDVIGGGVCQVSSTLYRAVLEAELDVVERYQHSMRVFYVEPSMDATIAENSLDFKFVNNLDAPIYIEGTTGEGVVTFKIYGHETRDPNRAIAFVSETFDEVKSEMALALNPEMDYGTYDLSEGHDGLSARAYKIIYMNGQEVERVHISSSYYVKADGHLTVGTKNAPAEVLPLLEQAVAEKDIGAMYVLSGYDVWGGTDGPTYGTEDAINLVKGNHGESTGDANNNGQTGENGGENTGGENTGEGGENTGGENTGEGGENTGGENTGEGGGEGGE